MLLLASGGNLFHLIGHLAVGFADVIPVQVCKFADKEIHNGVLVLPLCSLADALLFFTDGVHSLGETENNARQVARVLNVKRSLCCIAYV